MVSPGTAGFAGRNQRTGGTGAAQPGVGSRQEQQGPPGICSRGSHVSGNGRAVAIRAGYFRLQTDTREHAGGVGSYRRAGVGIDKPNEGVADGRERIGRRYGICVSHAPTVIVPTSPA